jgi:hypothetical protein
LVQKLDGSPPFTVVCFLAVGGTHGAKARRITSSRMIKKGLPAYRISLLFMSLAIRVGSTKVRYYPELTAELNPAL